MEMQAFGLHANANLSAAIKEGLGATWLRNYMPLPWSSFHGRAKRIELFFMVEALDRLGLWPSFQRPLLLL